MSLTDDGGLTTNNNNNNSDMEAVQEYDSSKNNTSNSNNYSSSNSSNPDNLNNSNNSNVSIGSSISTSSNRNSMYYNNNKLVEMQPRGRRYVYYNGENSSSNSHNNVETKYKLEELLIEYNYLLSHQLEKQRMWYTQEEANQQLEFARSMAAMLKDQEQISDKIRFGCSVFGLIMDAFS
jgi:hypothetical protein